MRRWQVKHNPENDWGTKGPDLFRTRPNARVELKDDMGSYDGGWYVRVNHGDGWEGWHGPHKRAEILEAFDGWNPGDKAVAQWGRPKDGGGYDPKGALRCRVVDVKAHNGCTDNTDRCIALLEAAWPQGAFGGAYVCKQISGSNTWSQHAYGRAYDHSPYDLNDKVTGWCLRMARENKMRDGEADIVLPVWQVLGSQGGKAGNGQNPDGDWLGPFEWRNGGVDDSHEWHVHLSTGEREKTGTPSCASKTLSVPVNDPHGVTDSEGE